MKPQSQRIKLDISTFKAWILHVQKLEQALARAMLLSLNALQKHLF